MKYLYFKTKGIAIPLAALQACGDLRFVDSAYVKREDGEGSEYKFFDSEMRDYYSRDCVVIDEKEILAKKPEEAE